jgi:VanZ family protein
LRYQVPAIVWFLVTVVVSSIPSDVLPVQLILGTDKLLHMAEYFVLAFLMYRAFQFQTRFTLLNERPVLFATLLTALYGPLDECHQIFTPGRSFDIYDMLADGLGALVFAAAFWGFSTLRGKRQTNQGANPS